MNSSASYASVISRIPEISDDELRRRANNVKPLVRQDGDGLLFYIKEPDLRKVAFMWDPEFTDPVEGVREVTRITTYHTWKYEMRFEPSIAEVLAQIPDGLLSKVTAFEVKGPGDVSDLNKHQKELREGYHVAETILYC